jgi:hypothetical protein
VLTAQGDAAAGASEAGLAASIAADVGLVLD